MPAKTKNSRKEENVSSVSKIFLSAVAGGILYFALLAVFAVLALKNGFDSSVYMPVGMFAGFITAMLGGFVTVRPIKKNGAVFGALCGLIQAILCALILFVANKAVAGTHIFILMAVIIAGGALGGIIAVNLKIKKRYK